MIDPILEEIYATREKIWKKCEYPEFNLSNWYKEIKNYLVETEQE